MENKEHIKRAEEWLERVKELSEKQEAIEYVKEHADTLSYMLEQTKLLKSLKEAYNDHMKNGTEEEKSEFIYVFRRIMIEHHMENKEE